VVLEPEFASLADQVTRTGHQLLEDWFGVVTETSGRGLDMVIWGRKPEESLNGTCYYGLLQCLWIRAQALMWQPGKDARMQGEAMLELHTALSMVGQDFRSDYMDSTRWPVRGIDVSQSIHRETITRVPSFKKLANSPEQIWAEVVQTAVRPGLDFFAEPPLRLREAMMPPILHVVAFGSHAALLSEPVTMIDLAAPELQVAPSWILSACRRQDPLHHYQCRLQCLLLRECIFADDLSNLGKRLLSLVEAVAEGQRSKDDAEAKAAGLPQLLDLAAQLWESDPAVSHADLAVCTIPLMCSLLRAVTPLPLLGYFAMTHYTEPSHAVGEWGMMHFTSMASDPSKNAFATLSQLWSNLGALQLGIQLPVVRPFCLYFFKNYSKFDMPNPFKVVPRSSGFHSRTILVPRSWLVMETSFLHMMRHFVDLVEPKFPFSFTVVRSAKPSPDRDVNIAINPTPHGENLNDILAEETNVFIDPTRLQLFRAAIFLPQMPQQLTFYELHSMHVPIFIPGSVWLYRLHHQRRYGSYHESRYRKGAEGVQRRMKPPLFNEQAVPATDAFHRWLMLYDQRYAMNLAGVSSFDSFPDLLEALLYTDLEELRERMRKDNQAAFMPALAWYRSAVLELVWGSRRQ